MICLHSIRGPIWLPCSRPPTKVGTNGYDWYSFVLGWSSAKVTNVSASWHLENKLWQVCFWPLPFVHAVVLPPGPRLWSVESLLRFCPFPNEMGLNPLPLTLNRLRLETNYELMMWSLCEDERVQKVIKTTKSKEKCCFMNFQKNQEQVQKIQKFELFFFEIAVVLSVWTEKVCVIRTFDADGPEKIFVLSKVRSTVVRLNRIFLTRPNAWPTICPGNVRTNELYMFVLSELVSTRFDCNGYWYFVQKCSWHINPLRANYCHTWHMENHPFFMKANPSCTTDSSMYGP